MKKLLFLLFFVFIGQLLAQTGPAGVGTADGFSELQLWLDANRNVFKDANGRTFANDTNRVRMWADLSGSGHHVLSKFDSNRPTFTKENAFFNSQNALLFARNASVVNNRNYLTSNSFLATDDISIYCVFHPIAKGGGNNVSPYVGSDKDTAWYGGSRIVDADVEGPKNDVTMTLSATSLTAGGGDSSTKLEYTVKTPLKLNKTCFGVLTKEKSSGFFTISKNGDLPQMIKGGAQSINNSAHYTIGGGKGFEQYGRDEDFFSGYISSVIIFYKKLSEAEGIILNNYLSARYAITLVQNDLYKMDEPALGNYDFELAGIGIGNDGIAQTSAKGEGMVEIGQASDLSKGEYLLWAHNGQSLNYQNQDFPEGVQQRLKRTWRVNEIGEIGKMNITIDTKSFGSTDVKELVLLIDADNNGSFENEKVSESMISATQYLGNGRYLFKEVSLNNENRFTFGTLKPLCQTDCDEAFSPNGDGLSDTYYLENAGKTAIFDKFGIKIKELQTPAYWDGTKSAGELASPGLYFVVTNDSHQKAVTLAR